MTKQPGPWLSPAAVMSPKPPSIRSQIPMSTLIRHQIRMAPHRLRIRHQFTKPALSVTGTGHSRPMWRMSLEEPVIRPQIRMPLAGFALRHKMREERIKRADLASFAHLGIWPRITSRFVQ